MKYDIHEHVAEIVCKKPKDLSCDECFKKSVRHICDGSSKCRILEKTNEQMEYVLSSIREDAFLKACAGSGKTEVVGLKAAYEIAQWDKKNVGIAILSFTNDAVDVIRSRVEKFTGRDRMFPHYIGTLSSFIHSYIVQPFAYKIVNFKNNTPDYSLQLIDENMETFTNHWLSNFKCKVPFINSRNIFEDIYAHQIGYDFGKKDFYFKKKYKTIWLKEYYYRENIQMHISSKRKSYPTYWEEKWVRDCFKECKIYFWKHGFASFDDMNVLAVRILKTEVADIISKRFPLIIIDECQDLSENELRVINSLQDKGCIVHFVGDLNQSIYDFKLVSPDKIYEHIKYLKTYSLNTNFRSCKEIVDFANQLIDEENHSENVGNKYDNKSLIYIEYNKPEEAVEKYVSLLKKLKCENGINRILVKQNSLRRQLENSAQDNYEEKESLIVALQLWKEKLPNNMAVALELAGKQFAKWFGSGTSKKNYYCPNEITSAFAWRIFLMRVLDSMECNPLLSDFNVTYGKWHEIARKELNRIIEEQYDSIAAFDSVEGRDLSELVNGRTYKVSSKNGNVQIIPLNKKFTSDIPIMTIHSSKGCTFDTTLVISSPKETSKGGHWKKHWIQGNGEEHRIGYVAFTRAKFLLVLGVPKLTSEDRNLIESYGFISYIKI